MGRTEPGAPVVSTDIGSRLTYWNYSLGSTLLKQVSGRISLFRVACYKLVKSLRYKNTSLADDGKDGTR
jgi:hypothetical protein